MEIEQRSTPINRIFNLLHSFPRFSFWVLASVDPWKSYFRTGDGHRVERVLFSNFERFWVFDSKTIDRYRYRELIILMLSSKMRKKRVEGTRRLEHFHFHFGWKFTPTFPSSVWNSLLRGAFPSSPVAFLLKRATLKARLRRCASS